MSGSPAPVAPGGSEQAVRGRGGFRTIELITIPAGLGENDLKAVQNAPGQPINLMSNYIKILPMQDRFIYSYRVDFEPELESVSLKRRLLKQATVGTLGSDLLFDGASEARSATKTPEVENKFSIVHPEEPNITYEISVKRVATVSPGSFEMLRLYNMNMRKCLEALGFFRVNLRGDYVHPALATPIDQSGSIQACQGYTTAANLHDNGDILMKLESCHKLMQQSNVLNYMLEIRQRVQNPLEAVKSMLIGKLIVTSYNKIVYRVEDINFNLSPKDEFHDQRAGRTISYMEYFKNRYNVTIGSDSQPLLLVIQNNRRKLVEQQGESRDIYVVPELCNIAGLTDQQRNDNRLKTDLIRSSQINPAERVSQLEIFLKKLHESADVKKILQQWGYSYDKRPIQLRGRTMPMEAIGVGNVAGDPRNWPRAEPQTGSFERLVMSKSLARSPELPRLAIVLPPLDGQRRQTILNRLRDGLDKISLKMPGGPKFFDLPNDQTQQYIQTIRSMPDNVTMIIAVLQSQNKERYDAIKKLASVERGLVTQVVTAKLLLDDRKAGGASTKIAIQIAAKIGGEPWFVDIPVVGDMICGYDTYHDTANSGRSYGAFLASMNEKFSRWFSKADSHDRLDELSSHLAQNLSASLARFKELNGGKTPKRVFMYRDGVSDGQIEFVFNIELKQIKKALDDFQPGIRLTFIVVNKRVGARFYMENNGRYTNPSPGSVIDNTITRKERFDFYLISQSTRNGTVAPTYYNIIHDESGLDAAKHQMLAYKLCFLYYNWTGTVRVPAPCQYAHKLALLCGEHLHNVPNARLDDRLHFL